MHQKKSELQIGKESSGISSDFNPTPPLLFPYSSIHPKPHNSHYQSSQICFSSSPAQFDPNSRRNPNLNQTRLQDDESLASNPSPSPSTPSHPDSTTNTTIPLSTTPHKRLVMNPTPSLVKSPTLSTSLAHYPFSQAPTSNLKLFLVDPKCLSLSLVFSSTKSATFRLLGRLRRLLFLLALPFFFFLLVSRPSHSLILDFFSAFAFSSALLFSLNLARPRLPSMRVLLNGSFPFPIRLCTPSSVSARSSLPVFWSIGSKQKSDKRLTSGCWVEVYSNGDVYEGEFHKGKCSGSGVYYYYMSGRYEGDWVDGKYDGFGVETWARGSRYRGQYRQGLRHGFGVYRFYTGDVYAGEWSNGQSHGCGIHTCEDGSRYVGEFKWGVKHGLGHYHFRNGDTYAGEYFADKMHGFGVYKFSNGHLYEGAWHEGKRQGYGMYTFRNGETQSGDWHNGILNVPSTQNTTGHVSSAAVNHSKVLNAVQEARSAAHRAYDVGKVDERVNRAVTAANRAANAARVASVKAVQKQMSQSSSHQRAPISTV